jgi:predicted nucleotidyltransferase
MVKSYPSLSWIKRELRNNVCYPFKKTIVVAYIIGSEAKGTAKENSDLDIAIIIEPIRGKSSLKKTEEYHQKFTSTIFKPKWDNRIVDIQFFYPGCPELSTYEKIKVY